MKNIILAFLLIFSTKIFSQTEKFFQINGVERKAIFYEPQIKKDKLPVVFVFHGHGGNAKYASKNLNFHENFPEALVIYMQGIPGAVSYTHLDVYKRQDLKVPVSYQTLSTNAICRRFESCLSDKNFR